MRYAHDVKVCIDAALDEKLLREELALKAMDDAQQTSSDEDGDAKEEDVEILFSKNDEASSPARAFVSRKKKPSRRMSGISIFKPIGKTTGILASGQNGRKSTYDAGKGKGKSSGRVRASSSTLSNSSSPSVTKKKSMSR